MLYLRIRKAKPHDIRFMEYFKMTSKNEGLRAVISGAKKQGIYNNKTYLPPRHIVHSNIFRKIYRKLKHEDNTR
jgi:hypothetical protein